MKGFTFYFNFITEEELLVATIYTRTIEARNLKEAIKNWTEYTQSVYKMITLIKIEQNELM